MSHNTIKSPKILHTTDYGMFENIHSNRDVDRHHLRRLTKAIQTKNLLYLFPIVVNKSMEVVDGQHRLKVAEALGLPIFYLIDNDITKADIAMVNNNRKSWVSKNFIDFYAKEGVKEYKQLKKLLDDYQITIMAGVRLMDGNALSYFSGGTSSHNLRSGTINGDLYELAEMICELCKYLGKERGYALKPPFMLDVKSAIIRSEQPYEDCIKKIKNARHILPMMLEVGDTCMWKLKEILPPPKVREEIDLEAIQKKQKESV